MDCPAELQEQIDRELTYTIPAHNPLDPPQVIKNMGIIRNGLISLPIGRTDLIPKDYEIVDKREYIPTDLPEFKFELRESQNAMWRLDNSDMAVALEKSTFGGGGIGANAGLSESVVAANILLERTAFLERLPLQDQADIINVGNDSFIFACPES